MASAPASKRIRSTARRFPVVACGKATHAATRRAGRALGGGSEDRYTVERLPVADSEIWFAAVYDGHGGADASEMASVALHKNLTNLVGGAPNGEDEFSRVLPCLSGDDEFTGDDVAEAAARAMIKAFRTTDDQILDADVKGGTTACVAAIGQSAFICAHAGDSRAILCQKRSVHAPTTSPAPAGEMVASGMDASDRDSGSNNLSSAAEMGVDTDVVRLTTDHKPAIVSERERIEAAGGMVLNLGGVPRVVAEHSRAMLAVSRALGNSQFKIAGTIISRIITDVPDCTFRRCDGSELLMVLMSDGVSDVLDDRETASVALAAARGAHAATAEAAAEAAAAAVVSKAVENHSPDDVTAVVVIFSDDAWRCGPQDNAAPSVPTQPAEKSGSAHSNP